MGKRVKERGRAFRSEIFLMENEWHLIVLSKTILSTKKIVYNLLRVFYAEESRGSRRVGDPWTEKREKRYA